MVEDFIKIEQAVEEGQEFRRRIGLTSSQIKQRRENIKAIAEKRRTATHCKRGHEFTPENTLITPTKTRPNKRQCKTCKNDRNWYYNRGYLPPFTQ
jgi:hypothetical protein